MATILPFVVAEALDVLRSPVGRDVIFALASAVGSAAICILGEPIRTLFVPVRRLRRLGYGLSWRTYVVEVVETAKRAGAGARRYGLQPLVLLLCLASLFLFFHIGSELMEGEGGAGLDRTLLLIFRTPGDLAKPIGPSWLLQSAIDISALGGFTFIWLFTAASTGFLVLKRRWKATGLLLASIVGVSILNSLIKIGFHRARPEVTPHLAEVATNSFPSGHAMISAATYLTIGALLARSQSTLRVRTYVMSLAVLLAAAIGVSRLYLGVHWPSDVLAGWALGSAWALAFWVVSLRVEPTSTVD